MIDRIELLFPQQVGLPEGATKSPITGRKSGALEISMLLLMIILLLQGLFEPVVTKLLTSNDSILTEFLPYKLYPLDLVAFPVIIFIGVLAFNSLLDENGSRKGKPFAIWISLCSFGLALLLGRLIQDMELFPGVYFTDLLLVPIALCLLALWHEMRDCSVRSNRFIILILWWVAISLGIVIGLLNDTPDLTGDFRKFLIRPLIAVAAFYIGLRIDFGFFFRWLVRISLIIALFVMITSLAYFVGFSWPLSQQISGFYGGLGLLLGYAYLLVRILDGKSELQTWMLLAFTAIAILTTLAKPLIGAFLVITILALLITAIGQGKNRFIHYLGFFVLLAMIGGVLYWLLFLEGIGGSYVATRYLKEGMAVQDLSGGRFSIWRLGWQKWLESPLMGQGSGYLLSGEIVTPGEGARMQFDKLISHNIVVQILYQLGLVGFLLIAGALLTWAIMVVKTLKSAQTEMPETDYYKTVVIMAGTVMVMSLYGSYIDNSITGFLLWTALGFEAALAVRIANLNG